MLGNLAQQTKDIIKLRDPFVKHLALNWGLIAGHQEYIKFILLGRSRTGSNFLRGLLNSRGGVATLGEILKNPDSISLSSFKWINSEFPISRQAIHTYKAEDIDNFVQTHIFRTLPLNIEACGFKIFYYHAQEESRKIIWQLLRTMNDLRVIHVKRRNILRTYLSWEKAVRSNQWINLNRGICQDTPIYLNYENCLLVFEQTRKWEQEYDTFFSENAVHEIYYEDLSNDTVREMEKIQEFFGLSIKPVAPQTFRHSYAPLSSAIENYYELRTKFRDTEWARFFDE
jgi:LPS sulfotransferase NodH